MTETTAAAPAQVAELDEERRRYESWLAGLEARRGATPPHVYERVRDDYLGRLQRVVERLAGHAEALAAAVGDLERRVAALVDRERQEQDDRAEAELRSHVGEYTAEQWQELQGASDAALADLAAERGTAEQELDRLRQLLALARGGDHPAAAAAADGAGQSRDGDGDGAVAAAAPSAEAPPTTRTPTPAADPLDLVLPEPAPTAAAAPPSAAERGAATAAAVSSAPEATEGAVVDGWSRELHDDSSALGAFGRGADGDPGAPPIKTLRCQECGTMNYPTEWYCERCGGELATL